MVRQQRIRRNEGRNEGDEGWLDGNVELRIAHSRRSLYAGSAVCLVPLISLLCASSRVPRCSSLLHLARCGLAGSRRGFLSLALSRSLVTVWRNLRCTRACVWRVNRRAAGVRRAGLFLIGGEIAHASSLEHLRHAHRDRPLLLLLDAYSVSTALFESRAVEIYASLREDFCCLLLLPLVVGAYERASTTLARSDTRTTEASASRLNHLVVSRGRAPPGSSVVLLLLLLLLLASGCETSASSLVW